MGAWGLGLVALAAMAGPVWGQQGRPGKPSAAVGAVENVTTGAAAAGTLPATGAREASVDAFLREFERASEANDADGKAALYGPEVDRYFLRTGVTRAFVQRDVLDWLSRGRLITRFRLRVLREEGTGEGVGAERTLLVRKEADWIAGGERREMVVRSQLVLRRGPGGWRIVGERDYKPG